MRNILLGFILGTFISVASAKLSSPPPLNDTPVALQHYLNEIYRNSNRLEVVTTSPNGSRSGKKGDMLHLQTGGSYYHCENIDSSTGWYCVELTNVP